MNPFDIMVSSVKQQFLSKLQNIMQNRGIMCLALRHDDSPKFFYPEDLFTFKGAMEQDVYHAMVRYDDHVNEEPDIAQDYNQLASEMIAHVDLLRLVLPKGKVLLHLDMNLTLQVYCESL